MRYTIKRGDTLSAIAQKHLGAATRYREIWRDNQQTFIAMQKKHGGGTPNPDKIYPGTIIDLPDSSMMSEAGAAPPIGNWLVRLIRWLMGR